MTTNNIVRFDRPANNIVPIDFDQMSSNMHLRHLEQLGFDEQNDLFELELTQLFDMADEIMSDDIYLDEEI